MLARSEDSPQNISNFDFRFVFNDIQVYNLLVI